MTKKYPINIDKRVIFESYCREGYLVGRVLSKNNMFLEKIANTVAELCKSEKLNELILNAISEDVPVVEIVEKGLSKGLDIVGEKYETLEYFLAELIYSGDLVAGAMSILEPHLKGVKLKIKGIIAIGTVQGDVHDIGKNIVAMLMKFRGWMVHDLGVDLPPERFVEAVKQIKPDILGMTSLLTTTTPMFKITIDNLKEAGLRSKVKVIIGGNAATEEIMHNSGADAWTTSAEDGIKKCEMWVKEK
jgi:methanogenic corrinoid protein MtbC1